MPTCVLDASAMIGLIAVNQSSAATRAFSMALPGELHAPVCFPLEVRHAILKLERHGRLGVGEVDHSLVLLEREIMFAPAPSPIAYERVLALARVEQLGMYDALYLDLAISLDAMLASRDGPLLAAAEKHGVAVEDLR